MIGTLLTKVFGTKNERELKKLDPLAPAINEVEQRMRALSDAEM